MLTIGRLARRFSLSRSTLLYYDRIGLLRPTARTPSNYRLYAETDCRRLERICFYRQAGLTLGEIANILNSKAGSVIAGILEKRLIHLNEQIRGLRRQQQVIVELLNSEHLPEKSRGLSREKWVALLRAAGMDDNAMYQWHVEFERLFPEDHHDFLLSLGIPEADIKKIREWS